MIINQESLLDLKPIKDMLPYKKSDFGVSYGLGEAGYDIRIKQDVCLNKYVRFTIASAMEEFDMPDCLTGIVHDKSTWARRGLSVFNTVIEPGWKGHLTIELVYQGNTEIIIPAGAGIAQVIFHRTAHPAMYAGKYQNQADRPVEAIPSV